jgi:hypothetical protein
VRMRRLEGRRGAVADFVHGMDSGVKVSIGKGLWNRPVCALEVGDHGTILTVVGALSKSAMPCLLSERV